MLEVSIPVRGKEFKTRLTGFKRKDDEFVSIPVRGKEFKTLKDNKVGRADMVSIPVRGKEFKTDGCTLAEAKEILFPSP